MKVLCRLISTIFILLSFLFISGNAFAQSTSDWPTFQRDSQHTGFNSVESTLTPPLTLLWSRALDTTPSGYPGIVSSNGTLFAKSNSGILYAIDNSSGNIKWQTQTQAGGAIAIANNTVYAGNNCDNCTLDAFDATTGQLIWSTVPLSRGVLGINVAGDKIFFGSHARNVRAADANTGAILWETGVSDGVVATPAVADGVVYIGSFCCTLYALDASTGSILWSRPDLGGVFFSSPTIANGVLYIGSGTARVFAVNASNGSTIWSFGPTEDSVWGTPAVANNIVYVQTLVGRLYAIDATSGTQIWTHKTQSTNNEISPLAIANGVAYQTSFDNNIYALNTQTGNLLWRYTTGGSVYSPIVTDNKLFFVSNDGKIYAFSNARLLTSLSPAKIWIGLKNSDDVGTRFDLKAEVYRNSTEFVSSGQLDNVWGGSSGFNNANLRTIPFNTFTPVDFPQGSALSIKLYVRNACIGPTHNSGTARLWYDDAAANSRFDATIEGTNRDYYLREIFVLSTTVGSGPKKKIDVQAGSPCSPFKTFGTWSITP